MVTLDYMTKFDACNGLYVVNGLTPWQLWI